VLLVNEAQEMSLDVLDELQILSSADFDATSLLTIILSGDDYLVEMLQQEHLVPLGTRICTRLVAEVTSHEELVEVLSHAHSKAGNATLMTVELEDTLVDHSASNYRLLIIMGAKLLAYGFANEIAQLDEKSYFELEFCKLRKVPVGLSHEPSVALSPTPARSPRPKLCASFCEASLDRLRRWSSADGAPTHAYDPAATDSSEDCTPA
jgi:hypothetical protein